MRVVVIGNGIAGYTAAETIKVAKPDTTVTIISEEDATLYSPCIFGHYLAGIIKRERLFLKQARDYQRAGIDAILGEKVVQIDAGEKIVHLQHRFLPYDKLVIATGSVAIIPHISDCQDERVTALKSIYDLDRVDTCLAKAGTRSVIIVGSGPVGLETAVSLRKRGYAVTLIELLERVMPKLLDEKLAAIVRSYLEEQGVQVVTGERVMSVSGNQNHLVVSTEKHEFKCNLVCLSVGMKPRVEVPREAGIELGQRGGIKVNPQMLTSLPDIYACGDCIETEDILTGKQQISLLWHTAKWQAYVAGKSCLGYHAKYTGSLNFTVLNLFEKWIVSSGHLCADFQDRSPKLTEINSPHGYLSFVEVDGRIVALQFVGSQIPQEIGRLIGMIRGKIGREQWDEMKDLYFPPQYRIPQLRSMWSSH